MVGSNRRDRCGERCVPSTLGRNYSVMFRVHLNNMRIISVALLLATQTLSAQPFAVGTRSVEFVDVERNRTVPCTVHYPSVNGGTAGAFASGTFPVLVHGHGFVMSVDAYTNLRDGFVPRGYILVLPTTEGGFSPSHATFGSDLRFLVEAMQAAHTDPTSPFFGHVAPATALLGHSMGGGASFLAASGNASVQTVVNFAAAETNPSAISAAASVEVPTLVFAAQEDRVTPPGTNQLPMYEALPVPCKSYVSVNGGGHCYFAANSLTCTFGESTLGAQFSISRAEQHDIVNDIAGLWLDHFLRDDQAAWSAFSDSLLFSTRITGERTCLSTEVGAVDPRNTLEVYPVPTADRLYMHTPEHSEQLLVRDIQGRVVLRIADQGLGTIDVRTLPDGCYNLESTDGATRRTARFVVLR